MSHYTTPFLVLNLGSEMVFVISQRLQAQNISTERSSLVLDEIISMLISNQLIIELMKPQQTYNQESVRDIIEDVTQSSAMRLDPISMNKLWDLITMVFKWQITISKNIVKLTLRHLYEIENYLTLNSNTQIQLHKIQNLINNFNKILTENEQNLITNEIINWLNDCNVRVSLLLRMGLQNIDGQFIVNNLNPIAEDMLKNLGENIYAVTQNGKILQQPLTNNDNNVDEKGSNSNQTINEPEVNELQLFVDQMIGETNLNDRKKLLRLSINTNNNNSSDEERIQQIFDSINVEEHKLDELMSDLTINNEENSNCLTEDLLEMIGGEDISN